MSIQNYKRDYFAEAHQLLRNKGYKNYIQQLLPGGKWQNNEYVVLNPTRDDTRASSFSINGNTGKWGDFANGDVGNDLIGLTAYIKGITPLEACYHIGVTHYNKTNSQTITNKNLKEDNMQIKQDFTEELPPISQEILDEIKAITEDKIKPTEEVLVQEPPAITAADTGYHNERTFKGFPSAFFPYKNSLGVTVGYIVRWDVKIEGGESKKGIRPYIYNFEEKRWKCKFFGSNLENSRPLYNLPEILKRENASILIVEGEKTCEAAKLLFPEFVATTSSGGAKSVKKTDWHWLRGRNVIISPDDGKAGGQYLEEVIKTLTKEGVNSIKILEPLTLGNYIVKDGVYIKRTTPLPHGYDLADSLEEGWTTELIQQAIADEQFAPFFRKREGQIIIKSELGLNEELYEFANKTYKLASSGLYLQYFVEAKPEDLANNPEYGQHDYILAIKEKWRPLCGYLKPTHKVRDNNNSWGMLVSFKDINNITRETFLKRTDWLGEKGAVEILQDQGLQLMGLKQKDLDPINEYLNNFKPEFEAVGVDMVGWQGDNDAYMLPFVDDPRNCYRTSSENHAEYILQQKSRAVRVLKKKGTLEEWKRTVGEVCRGNHLHTFAILVSLAAPILKLLGEEGGFFHYVGNTSIGKSTILQVAKSVWGFKDLGSFRTTDNSLESICKNSNDGALFSDEMGEVDADILFKSIYMVGNGTTKSRADTNGNAKEASHFIVLAQSTGEIGLEAKLAEKKLQAKGGQLIRMIELDADRGKGLNTFDVLNINPDTSIKFEDGKAQAEYLKTHAQQNYGVVIDEFMKKLVKDIEAYKKGFKQFKMEWLENLKVTKGNPEIDRIAGRFSIMYIVGAVASFMKVIPHTKSEVKECVDNMFNNWLIRRGGDDSYELKVIINDLYKLCVENQYSRFQNAHPIEDERENLPKDKAGYWKMEKDEDGNWFLSEFWIHTQVFERDILKGRDKKVFYPLLVQSGYIEKGKDGQTASKRRPKNGISERFIVVPISAFTNEEKTNQPIEEESKKNGIIKDGEFYPVNDCAE